VKLSKTKKKRVKLYTRLDDEQVAIGKVVSVAKVVDHLFLNWLPAARGTRDLKHALSVVEWFSCLQ